MKTSLVAIVVIVVVMGWAASAPAAACWDDGFGGTILLEIAKQSGDMVALFGKQITTRFTCQQGTTVHPVQGSAVVVGDRAILGLWTFHDGGDCLTDTLHMVLDLRTFGATGILRSVGDPGVLNVTWTPKPCP